MKKLSILLILVIAGFTSLLAQPERWQQRAEYMMEIDMNVENHRFSGKQKLIYFNNSPDTLDKVFYHLYFNAFQPGSMMDTRSRNLPDPDRRVGSRIFYLSENEIGYQKIESLAQNGKDVKFHVEGTILEVILNEPILPNSEAVFDMEFEAQVPIQVRRSGRDSKEGISYSMAQWYPKMAEYDYKGWHANPYVAREFYGIWGDFDVKITIDSSFMLGGTGYLQNPEKIGHGYEDGKKVKRPKGDKLTWHFKAENVHDFVWAADPDYVHTTYEGPNGTTLHFFHQPEPDFEEGWKDLPEYTAKAMEIMNEKFGLYPYKQYSVVQGGDGGMEYPMATLITGKRGFRSLLGVTVHEMVHSWFQMVLGTNESLHAWMDEGFDSYASDIVMRGLFTDSPRTRNSMPHQGSYLGYFSLVKSGKEEPLTTHSDHFDSNRAYGIAAYSKGAVFLHQLSYVVGQEVFEKGMLNYFDTWKYKHPNPNDFIRVMEKTAGLELDWYLEYFRHTTKFVDYGIKSVVGGDDKTYISLERVGKMPMPIELVVEYTDGNKETYYMPLRMMRGEKEFEDNGSTWVLKPDWPWTHEEYKLVIPRKASEIKTVEIDPSQKMADLERDNNLFDVQTEISLKEGSY